VTMYAHRFPRPRCCPRSTRSPRFKNIDRANRTQFCACSFRPISSDEAFLPVN